MNDERKANEEEGNRNEESACFAGFPLPENNFYPLPNSFTDLCANIESLAELKIILYLVRHTWGYHEYMTPKSITTDEFMYGRKRKDGTRMDQGTRLSDRGVRNGIALALRHGYVICERDDRDKARIKKYYVLKMSDQTMLEEKSSLTERNTLPAAGKTLPSARKHIPTDSEHASYRSEKHTLETHEKKDISRKSRETEKTRPEHTAALPALSFSKNIEKGVLPPTALRQHPSRSCMPQDEGNAKDANKQRATVFVDGGAETDVPDEVSSALLDGTLAPPLLLEINTNAMPQVTLTEEEIIQKWEELRGQTYTRQERIIQLQAARKILEMQLPDPLDLAVLHRLYTTSYDAFWRENYGELHLSHLLSTEKSSGQVRIIRWIRRLQIQDAKQDMAKEDNPSVRLETRDQTQAIQIISGKVQTASRSQRGYQSGFERFKPGDHPDDDLDEVVKRLQTEGKLPVFTRTEEKEG